MDPRAGLDSVMKRKIPSPLPGLEPPIIQSVAHWDIPDLIPELKLSKNMFIYPS
jgi:hypothetical protein